MNDRAAARYGFSDEELVALPMDFRDGLFAGPAIDFTPRGWQAVIDTNLNGSWYMMQAAAKRWIRLGAPGRIVNIVSTIWRGRPTTAHSCAARAGVIFLSKTLAVEWAPHRLQVNCVAPGVIETSAFARYPADGVASYYEQPNLMKRPGDVQDIAQACAYLCASGGKFITGEVLAVDGGQQLWGDPWPGGRPAWFSTTPERTRAADIPDASTRSDAVGF